METTTSIEDRIATKADEIQKARLQLGAMMTLVKLCDDISALSKLVKDNLYPPPFGMTDDELGALVSDAIRTGMDIQIRGRKQFIRQLAQELAGIDH